MRIYVIVLCRIKLITVLEKLIRMTKRSEYVMCAYWEDAVRDFYRIQKIQYINKKIKQKRKKLSTKEK